MKLVKLLVIMLLIGAMNMKVFLSEKLQNQAKSRAGVSTNYPGTNNVPDAFTYGYANQNGYVLESQAGFISPTIMPRIPEHLNEPYTGVMASPDTVSIIII